MKLLFYPSNDDAAFLRPREVANRLRDSHLAVVIDWNQSNAIIQTELESLLNSGAPNLIVDAHKAQFDNCPFVHVNSVEKPSTAFSGMIWFDTVIELNSKSSDRASAKQIGQEIERIIGYNYEYSA